jgi:membrane fusion protein, multidrug efflux system
MKRSIIIGLLVVGAAGGAYYMWNGESPEAAAQTGPGGQSGRGRQGGGGGGFGGPGGGFGGPGGGFGGGGPRMPMTVEVGAVKRADMSQKLTVVGNLIGAATVETGPKVNGRLETVAVRMGDRVSRGQRLAKIEDRELLEQIKQARASFDVTAATIRQREADLRLAQTNLERSRSLFERELIPKQTFDDTDARQQAAIAQLDLAKAQYAQSQARLDELDINLANTVITSPVNGFISKRTLDPGAWVTPNSVFLSVVDISIVRIVADVVERDLRRITQGLRADVEVDAFPGETFTGRVAHVAPVLDPSTRTAQIEIEIANSDFRLKPGMYARVSFTIEQRENTLVVPTSAIVNVGGNPGVFLPSKNEENEVAKFKPVQTGMSDQNLVEVSSGLTEGERVVTTGAAALRDGDRILLAGGRGGGTGRQGGGPGRGRQGSGAPGGEGRSPAGGDAPGSPRSGGPRPSPPGSPTGAQ